jgi:hypothetical protein
MNTLQYTTHRSGCAWDGFVLEKKRKGTKIIPGTGGQRVCEGIWISLISMKKYRHGRPQSYDIEDHRLK